MPRNRRQPADHVTCRHCGREFRAISILHLRNIHDYGGDDPVGDYKRRFRLQFVLCPDARKKLSRSKETFWASKGRHWTRAKLIADIRRRRRAGQSLRPKNVPVRLSEAGRRIFGSWQKAVEAAGLEYEKATGIRHWSPARIVMEIQEVAQRRVPLHASYVKERYPTLFSAAVKHFPNSWAKALRAAGLNPNEHRQPRGRWNARKALNWVKQRLAKQRSVLARDAPADLQRFVRNRIGMSWTEFIESFGIEYPGVKKRRDWSKAMVLAEIRDWIANGNRMNYRAIKQDFPALLHQARKFFQSWDNARAAAGIPGDRAEGLR